MFIFKRVFKRKLESLDIGYLTSYCIFPLEEEHIIFLFSLECYSVLIFSNFPLPVLKDSDSSSFL